MKMRIKIKNYQLNFSSCHRIPERSFFFFGKQFPICARCTGINVPFLLLPLFVLNLVSISLLYSFLLVLPAIIDGITQAFCNRESNNYLRFITGFLMGLGLVSLSTIAGKTIGAIIINILK